MEVVSNTPSPSFSNRELTNRRLSHDDEIRLRDVTSAHAYMGTCQSCAKVETLVRAICRRLEYNRTRGQFSKFSECFFSLSLKYFLFLLFSDKQLIKYQSRSLLMFFLFIYFFFFSVFIKLILKDSATQWQISLPIMKLKVQQGMNRKLIVLFRIFYFNCISPKYNVFQWYREFERLD